jgi:hypothetical protein
MYARVLERACARFERRSRRAHVVYQHDDGAGENLSLSGRRECLPDVAVTPSGGQSRLRAGRADATQGAADGQAGVPREIVRLVEPAVAATRWMKRDRNRAVRAVENRCAALAHQRAQRPRERAAAVVLQGVDDGAKRAVVRADRACAIDEPFAPPAARAARERDTNLAPGRQRIAAAIAQRRRERENRAPAAPADRTVGGMVERLVAGRASGSKNDAEDSVSDRRETCD